jgi:hypothetical protein
VTIFVCVIIKFLRNVDVVSERLFRVEKYGNKLIRWVKVKRVFRLPNEEDNVVSRTTLGT